MKNICAILNISPFYRKAIYSLMDQQLDVDFFFGDYSVESISLMNPSLLKGFKNHLKNCYHGTKLVWQKGALRAAFLSGGYCNYILTGNPGIKSNWIILIVAKLLHRKVWLWTHGLRGNETGKSRLVNIIYMKLASGLLFYNERSAEIAKEVGVNPSAIHVIYNSLDYEVQKKCREKVGDAGFLRNYFGNDLPYVLFIGRLTPSKRVDTMLRALRNVNCNIVIVGDGPERGHLEQMTIDYLMDNRVWFYGECYDEQMNAQFIYHSVALISPGNIGLSAIHAMTYGAVAITHNNFDFQMPEVEAVEDLEKELGCKLLFEYDNEESLSEVVSNAISFVDGYRNEIRYKCYSIIEDKWNAYKQIQIFKNLFGI